MTIEIIELSDQWEDGDLIHLLARGTYREDHFRAECGAYLKDAYGVAHPFKIGQVHHVLYRMIPRGERGDEWRAAKIKGRGAFPVTIADIGYKGES